MIFHEIYGSYYRAVGEILTLAVRGTLTHDEMERIVHEVGFAESFLTILPALKEQRWQLLCDDLSTPLKNEPTMPLTTLQRRWLKAVSLDPRARLFWQEIFSHQPSFFENMEEEPLFLPEDYVIFDRYSDGDPYADEKYIEIFRTVMEAIRSKREVWIKYRKKKGGTDEFFCRPYRMEYSEKDDKFRAYVLRDPFVEFVINIGRIEICSLSEGRGKNFRKSAEGQSGGLFKSAEGQDGGLFQSAEVRGDGFSKSAEKDRSEWNSIKTAKQVKKPERVLKMSQKREPAESTEGAASGIDKTEHGKLRRRNIRSVIMELRDGRNALERAMLHFAHFKKEAERIGEDKYRIRVWYDKNDETELLIRVLSFGPFIRVTEPSSFVSLIKERLKMQRMCGLL